MTDTDTRIREALEKKGLPPEVWVNVTFQACLLPDGQLQISEPCVRTPWIPTKSKTGS